ncbi:TetR/AcrR family transcriptional regulator [Pusillimonas sp. T2]|uniref:TetR/AcrR family transcriptional regulator n=1 Tax=Pusillimonas sp. T2 TaxID=1548123 RepID=UPI0013034DA8|nr:TetR/AcrR family transcriptional regulator [Pusillimonas sp. T2]
MGGVLDKATSVFRKRGYHAASISELSKATGLTEGSLYKAFAGKEALFIAVFDRYCARRQDELSGVLARESHSAAKLQAALTYYVQSSTGAEGQLGCLIVGSVSALDLLEVNVASKVREALQRNESTLVSLIEQGVADGAFREDIDPIAAAKLLWCTLMGIRVAGKAGVKGEELGVVVEQAMRFLK